VAIIKSKKLRKVLRVVGIAAAAYFGAPYLLSAAGTVASGASTAFGTALAGRLAGVGGGSGGAPPEQFGGGTFINIGSPGGPMGGGNVGYSDIGAGGAGSQIFPGGPFDAPAVPSFSPGLLLGIGGAVLGLFVLIILIRR